jgi:hypothetical protein
MVTGHCLEIFFFIISIIIHNSSSLNKRIRGINTAAPDKKDRATRRNLWYSTDTSSKFCSHEETITITKAIKREDINNFSREDNNLFISRPPSFLYK